MLAFGKIFARLIHKKIKTLVDVPEKYKEATTKAYKLLYGADLNE